MENVTENKDLTRGQKIAAALKGKKWSPERKAAFSQKAKENRELFDKTGGKEGYKLGRKAAKVE